MIGNGAHGGVRSDERNFADFERVVKSFVGDVRDVDEDALAIHFADDVFAEVGEAIVRGLVGGGVGPLVIFEMREGHVANAESGVDADHADVVADHVAAFDAHEDGDFFLGVGAANVVGGSGEEQIVGMIADGVANGVDLVESFLDGGWALDAGVDEDGEEQGVEAAFAHAGDVDVAAAGVALGEVVVLGREELGGVGVGVEDDGREMELTGVVGGGIGGGEWGNYSEKKDKGGQKRITCGAWAIPPGCRRRRVYLSFVART